MLICFGKFSNTQTNMFFYIFSLFTNSNARYKIHNSDLNDTFVDLELGLRFKHNDLKKNNKFFPTIILQ